MSISKGKYKKNNTGNLHRWKKSSTFAQDLEKQGIESLLNIGIYISIKPKTKQNKNKR